MTEREPWWNVYAGLDLDRAEERRADQAWISGRLADPGTRFLPVWRSKHLVQADLRPVWLVRDQIRALESQAATVVFLGLAREVAHVAIDLSFVEAPERHPVLAGLGEFRDLREVGPLIDRRDSALLAYARALTHWHRRHGFCGSCGSPTRSEQGGHVLRCARASCDLLHFPRLDPAVIMLVHDSEHCLLGRQRHWPPGLHSTLAGFVEAGETLEEAVAREIREEVGLSVDPGRVAYHSSQPWPFPSSLMVGFHVRHGREKIVVSYELESAAWYRREELLASPENEVLRLPRRDSIARRLIEDWLYRAD